MSLIQTRQEIAKYLRNLLPNAQVSEHGGSLDLAEMKRVSVKAPSVFVTCLGLPVLSVEGGMTVSKATFALFVCSSHATKMARDVAVLTTVEAICTDLPLQRWNSKANNTPKGVQATNMYSSELDSQGVNLWAIRWQQQVDLENGIWSTLDDLLRVYADYDFKPDDVTGRDNPDDHIDLAGP